MNTTFLETLVWLTRLKSFSRTAEKLNTSQPSVSNRINKLEELLDIRLYDRGARQFELTPAGRRILRHAEAIVSLSSELRELAASDESEDIHIRIGVIEVATMSWLPSYIEAIAKSFPKASFQFGTGTSKDLLGQLKRDEVDLIFVSGPLNEPNIGTSEVCRMRMSWFANPTIFDCDRSFDISELADLPVILSRPESSGYTSIVDYFRSCGISHVPQRHNRITLDCVYSVSTARELAVSGLGIIALPTFLMEKDVKSGAVAVLQVKQTLPPFELVVAYKKPMIKSAIGHLIEIANDCVAQYSSARESKDMWR
ncbi:LysR family transcriptional regulator [Paraburkholderia sp. BL25I1N1]|uniref:LysR family transcriptional regulator n=1 Tax=Paraburkholderia sp. BL25I1N1 TaxID=1938804 RepID=UPI0015E5B23E|nr:LysR family transcriptional regulator [Paraburkholderia sp. BL25I1N1]